MTRGTVGHRSQGPSRGEIVMKAHVDHPTLWRGVDWHDRVAPPSPSRSGVQILKVFATGKLLRSVSNSPTVSGGRLRLDAVARMGVCPDAANLRRCDALTVLADAVENTTRVRVRPRDE